MEEKKNLHFYFFKDNKWFTFLFVFLCRRTTLQLFLWASSLYSSYATRRGETWNVWKWDVGTRMYFFKSKIPGLSQFYVEEKKGDNSGRILGWKEERLGCVWSEKLYFSEKFLFLETTNFVSITMHSWVSFWWTLEIIKVTLLHIKWQFFLYATSTWLFFLLLPLFSIKGICCPSLRWSQFVRPLLVES